MQMMTGVDQSDYSKIENGKRYMSFEQCMKLADALDTGMDYFAGRTDQKEPYPNPKRKQKKTPNDRCMVVIGNFLLL